MPPDAFAEMLALEERGLDRFVATGPAYPWGVLYGGQVVAQALRAAGATVDGDRHVNSLHAYYLSAGADGAPIELEVARVRDGRSFSVRSVLARQEGRTLVSLTASFHVDEGSDRHDAVAIPEVEGPEGLRAGGWSPMFDRRYAPLPTEPGRVHAWLRLRTELGDDPLLQGCALAFMADDIPDDAVVALLHPTRPPSDELESRDWSISTQSLDFALWLHRPLRSDGWQLHDLRCSTLVNSCAMVAGEIFAADGSHLATLSQQVLVRRRP